MKTKRISIVLLAIMVLSLITIIPVHAATFPNLPAGPVTLTLAPVGVPKWPGTAILSDVPSGFDVTNGPYTAYCAQFHVGITRETPYSAILTSSLDLPTPWDKINYLLNNNDGEDMDLQVAIWLLLGTSAADITGRYPTQPSTDANTLYANANSMGAGFIPSAGDLVAVQCDIEGQDLIIYLRKPGLDGLSPGFWKHNIRVRLGKPGRYSVPHDGEPRITDAILDSYLATIGVTDQQAYAALTAKGKGSRAIRLGMANLFNDAAGYTPYND